MTNLFKDKCLNKINSLKWRGAQKTDTSVCEKYTKWDNSSDFPHLIYKSNLEKMSDLYLPSKGTESLEVEGEFGREKVRTDDRWKSGEKTNSGKSGC